MSPNSEKSINKTDNNSNNKKNLKNTRDKRKRVNRIKYGIIITVTVSILVALISVICLIVAVGSIIDCLYAKHTILNDRNSGSI